MSAPRADHAAHRDTAPPATAVPTTATDRTPDEGPDRGPHKDTDRESATGMELRKVLVLNGPNLGRLGSREPDVYGSTSYPELVRICRETGRRLGFDVDVRETNDEGELIRWLHEAADGTVPVVLNPGAFTHYSYGLRDAIAQRTAPLVEVHISNPHAREEFRHTSVVAAVASGTIAGFGIGSYRLALHALAEELAG